MGNLLSGPTTIPEFLVEAGLDTLDDGIITEDAYDDIPGHRIDMMYGEWTCPTLYITGNREIPMSMVVAIGIHSHVWRGHTPSDRKIAYDIGGNVICMSQGRTILVATKRAFRDSICIDPSGTITIKDIRIPQAAMDDIRSWLLS